ncbi:hypothetical protein FSP39_012312 [Pinctada imbricata]|uniref:non-specific serine/threonine protein kinase n=1 Tax=Pinctada imbricata TaxID=66713 RepID=A0AA88XLA3_PINIB|nr:hypothetical protein FSP39_012312 [Pinctada imbricata]
MFDVILFQADYLQPHLLGVITYFDSNLMNAENPKSLKKLILESLTALIKLMGKKHISRIRQRVYSTLKIGLELKDSDFNDTNCKAWDCFVRSLETPLLGQMMPQIVAALLPLLKDMPKGVADIFNFIILEHRESLAGSLHEVYFLPDIPELAEAHTVLKQCTEQGPSSHCDLKSKLRDAMKGIQHECLDIRLHALSKLRKLLREDKEKFYDYVIGNETADPIVTELVSVLLKGCRETDSRAQCLYAECIGEVGAIDPGRLELMTNNPKEHLAKFQISIEDDSFALGVISEGVKAYLTASEGIVQDCAALALQELLKIYRVPHPQGSNKDPSGKKIWDRLDEQAQQILLPFFQSRYMYKEKSPWDYSKLKKPLYCSEEKYKRYSQWVCKWTGYLSSKVKKEKPGLVFRACEAVVLNNLHMALYIQPFIVFQIVVDNKQEDREEIFSEINEVLNQTVKSDGKSRTGSSNAHHLATQTICTVIDYLVRWRQYKAQNTNPLPSKPREPLYLADAGYKAVDSFLQRVPHYQIANACFKCKAFTRSLMHIELHLQDKKQNLQDHLDFIQRLYRALDEPDGVVGVSAIRQTPQSLMEQILIHDLLFLQRLYQALDEPDGVVGVSAIRQTPQSLMEQILIHGLLLLQRLYQALDEPDGVVGLSAIRQTPQSLMEQILIHDLLLLQRLYQALDEPDGVVGVSAVRQTPQSLMEQILIHESLGQHEDAQSCYEKAIQTEPDEVSYHQGLLYSLMELGQVNKALLHATGAVAKKVDWNPQLYNYMVEAAWKLGRWQELENFAKSDKQSRTWAVGVGKVLMAAKEKKEYVFMQHLQILRQEQMGPLSAASMESGSYLRGYQYIVRLHMINEIEESLRLLLNLQTHTEDGEKLTCATSIEQMIKYWETRIQITQCSFRTEEPVLTLRRALFTLAQKVIDQRLDHEIGHWWLESAKIARE